MTAPLGNDLDRAARLLREGELVAFATETVYGLGGNALDPLAVAKIFEAKQRPRFDPLIVHVAERGQIDELAASFSPLAERLAEAFWPGPLTLVVPKTGRVPDLVTSGLLTVALRIPSHPMARELLRKAGIPVAAPSANPFGRVSPTRAEHVAEQLGDKVSYILDGGPCTIGLESTVVLVSGEVPLLLRHGGLPLEEIERVVGRVELPQSSQHPSAMAQPAPGMLPRHYAPRTPLIIAEAGESLSAAIRRALPAVLPDHEGTGPASPRVGWMSLGEESIAGDSFPFVVAVRAVLSKSGDLREGAAKFFDTLRQLDARGLDLIVVRRFPEVSLGRALNDRLQRAAATFSTSPDVG